MLNFEPSHGKVSMKRADERFQHFLKEAFDADGNRNLNQKATPSEKACKYCVAKNNDSLCTVSYYLPGNKKKFKKG
jgi:hypothetical protein